MRLCMGTRASHWLIEMIKKHSMKKIIRIEQVPLKDNEHHKPRELFALKRRKERQHEKLVNDTILQKKNRQSRVSISRLFHNSRLQGLINYVRLRHVSLKMHKKKSNNKEQMKMPILCRGSTVDLEEDNMFLVLDTSWVDLRAY